MFAPVIRLNTLRTLLAYCWSKKMLIHQMDVTTAFLIGYLDQKILMKQPPAYVKYHETGKELVCQLQRPLYGLQQLPQCWNKTFCNSMKRISTDSYSSICG